MKKKKTDVRSPRKTSARPTREKTPKLREGGRQSSSPFKTDWKYLDLSSVASSPKKAGGGSRRSTDAGRDRAKRSQRLPPSGEIIYYEPPPERTPFRDLTERQVIDWYLAQPGDRRRHILEGTATWKWFNNHKRDHKALIENADLIKAGAMMTPPSTSEIVEYLRKMQGPPCSCGWMGYPYEDHTFGPKCFRNKPPELEDDEDDDLPF